MNLYKEYPHAQYIQSFIKIRQIIQVLLGGKLNKNIHSNIIT